MRFAHVKALCVTLCDSKLTVANRKSDFDGATLGLPTSLMAFDITFVSNDQMNDTFSELA